jgi:hypothetical protein
VAGNYWKKCTRRNRRENLPQRKKIPQKIRTFHLLPGSCMGMSGRLSSVERQVQVLNTAASNLKPPKLRKNQ